MENEEILSQNLRSGNVETYEMVFKAWYKALCKALCQYAWTFLKDKDEAEDIVQQVFISFWEKRGELEIKNSVKSLLYKSVCNASLNRIKQKNVRSSYAKEAKVLQLNSSEQSSIEEKELRRKIESTIEELPEQCRKIFRMSRFEQKKYQEIADELKLSVKTVENQMGKALKILREQLKDYLPLLLILLKFTE